MKYGEIREKSPQETDLLESRLRKELADLWLGVRAGHEKNTAKIGKVRRDVARVLTARRSRIARETVRGKHG